eukprot:CAMPEP_0182526242 /NCGR_PEP_ID=MMETSP1323-20130603/3043_1 /TAXON_ID=236787 /ORGANISM="Florenciella parvula, Strain RCC1693" /LENGTH=53 /DNA_ID=CAMNT_0024735061 /DNA_START=94 /DNA_END=252 /DNA_ORIENTATION=+
MKLALRIQVPTAVASVECQLALVMPSAYSLMRVSRTSATSGYLSIRFVSSYGS